MSGLWRSDGKDLDEDDLARLHRRAQPVALEHAPGRWSLARDLKILIATIPAVFSGRGTNPPMLRLPLA